MAQQRGKEARGERGSALVIAILVVVILTLLGVSFLLMADTENRIAENEKLSAQALYFGEAGVRMVKRWFDSPASPANLINPPINVINRTLRLIDDDGDSATLPHLQDGSAMWPRYKQGVDLNGDGIDDVFDRPYRPSKLDTLLGTADGPDMRIDEGYSAAAKTFLANFSNALLSNYPAAAGGVRARITRMDVYAPPYINVAGGWTRYGMATVAVTARIYKIVGASEQVLAERLVKAVLNETPYPGPFGPLHSCDQLQYNGEFSPHWGTVTSIQNMDLPTNLDAKVDDSIPRASVPVAARVDSLWGADLSVHPNFLDYKADVEAHGSTIEDPWLRFVTGKQLLNAPNSNPQPYPFTWSPAYPATLANPDDHSNLYQGFPGIATCPQFDYDTWKTVATTGGENVHYYTWSSGSSFQENGLGAPATFEAITNNQTGLYFFDTQDGNRPLDSDGNGIYENLTPSFQIGGGTWGIRGFIYLNAFEFATKGVNGQPAVYHAPGEPYLDQNSNGTWDAGEPYINLSYPTTLGGTFQATNVDNGHDNQGPAVNSEAVVWGVLYTNGYWDATGNAKYYGSVITKQGVEVHPAAGTPDLYWDESIVKKWPPDGWNLPRVIITRWDTDL